MARNVKITLKESKLKKSKKDSQSDEKIVQEAQKNAGEWFDYYNDNIANHRADFDFCYAKDGQWTAPEITESNELAKFGKTRITFNMMIKVINTLVGEFDDVDPEYKVRNTDTVTIDQQLTQKIEVLTGLIRNISKKSRFDEVKKAAFDSAINGGFGAFCVVVEQDPHNPFNQVARFKEINDPTTCFWDRTAQKIDKSDGRLCGRCYIWKKEAVKSKYGIDISESNYNDNCNQGFDSFTWLTKDDVIITDYYKKELIKRTVALLSNKQWMDLEKAQKLAKLSKKSMTTDAIKILEEKTIDDDKIYFYRIIGNEIVERTEWPGKKLPIIFQGGIIKKYRGQEYTFSVIRWLKSAQRTYNFARNETIYRIKKMRNEPYLVADGNTQGHEDEWKNAHLPRSALKFKEVSSGFIPRREPAGDVPQALFIEAQSSFNDIQQILGRFSANQGETSNEQTGRAQELRQLAGNLSVKPFFNSAKSALQSGAEALLDVIPHVYDNDRLLQIANENGKVTNVRINDGDGISLDSTDSFEIEVSVGASFEIQRAKAIELLLKAYSANPALTQISTDILAKNLDLKDATLLTDRVMTYLQPQITQDESQKLSQEDIIKRNQEQSNEAKQTQQQLVTQNMQLDQMIKQSKMQDDKVKALSNQVTAMANMMNARTNQNTARQEGVIAQQKTQAEMTKAMEEERTARLKLAKEAIEVNKSEFI